MLFIIMSSSYDGAYPRFHNCVSLRSFAAVETKTVQDARTNPTGKRETPIWPNPPFFSFGHGYSAQGACPQASAAGLAFHWHDP